MYFNKYIAWISLFVLSSASCQESLDIQCTEKKTGGSCVLISSCDYVLKLIRQGEINEAKTRFCGFENNIPKVCCPKGNAIVFQNEPPATNRPKRVTTPSPVLNKTVTPQPDPFPSRSICGQAKSSDRILGGEIAGIDEFPWLALIKHINRDKEQYGCAGSLITDRHVLTAAHCVFSFKVISVRLGEFDTNTEQDCVDAECNEKPLDVAVKDVIVYPEFSMENYTYGDLAVLVLAHSVNFTDFIQPVCLPTTEYIAAQDYIRDSTYTTAGWGLTEHEAQSAVKRKVMLNAVPIETCEVAFQATQIVIPKNTWANVICAGGKKLQDSCQGDSGGPLVREISENYNINWYLFGITSFGAKRCGEEGIPGGYTRVTVFMDWIREQVSRT